VRFEANIFNVVSAFVFFCTKSYIYFADQTVFLYFSAGPSTNHICSECL